MCFYKPYLLSCILFILCFCHSSIIKAEDCAPPAIRMPTRGLCAHRGASATHPENTLSALKEAIRLGAHQIEFDVRLTKDKKLILMHDSTINRTTNGKGKVNTLTFKQIRKLDAGSWKHKKFKNERIPTLVEVLEIMPINVWLNVDIKGGPSAATQAVKTILKHKRQHQAFITGNFNIMKSARKLAPKILLCNLQRRKNKAAYAKETMDKKINFIQYKQTLGASADIKKLKKSNVMINLYPATRFFDVVEMLNSGADFVLVDNLSIQMQNVKKLKIDPHEPIFRNQNVGE